MNSIPFKKSFEWHDWQNNVMKGKKLGLNDRRMEVRRTVKKPINPVESKVMD